MPSRKPFGPASMLPRHDNGYCLTFNLRRRLSYRMSIRFSIWVARDSLFGGILVTS